MHGLTRPAPPRGVSPARPAALVLGWGFRAQAQASSFASCWDQAQDLAKNASTDKSANKSKDASTDPAQLSPWAALLQAPASLCLAVLDHKLANPAGLQLQAWAAATLPGAPCLPCDERRLRGLATPHQSPRMMQRFATGSLCEALALHAAGLNAGSQPDARGDVQAAARAEAFAEAFAKPFAERHATPLTPASADPACRHRASVRHDGPGDPHPATVAPASPPPGATGVARLLIPRLVSSDGLATLALAHAFQDS
ncbi:cobalamin biosynthesis protein [Comamonas serinivorans]|nr:cobalamin biosynthesis protein [Comamonas serinivorans]